MILAALVLALAAPGQIVAPEQAPAAWQTYAASARTEVEALLSGGEPAAAALRETLVTAPDGTPVQRELVLAIAVDATGEIARAEIAGSPSDLPPAADTQLKALLLKRRLPGTPPADMRQPMRIGITIAPAPAAESDTTSKGENQ